MNISFRFFKTILIFFTLVSSFYTVYSQQDEALQLASKILKISWRKGEQGWAIRSIDASQNLVPGVCGYYTVLYSSDVPSNDFVKLNQAGSADNFYPEEADKQSDGSIKFLHRSIDADVEAKWEIDSLYSTDIHVNIILKAKKDGYFSIASPTIARINKHDLAWGMVPGNWYGTEIQKDILLSTKYSMGLPYVPVVGPERSTMTLCPLVSTTNGITLAVIPDPGMAADPWPDNKMQRSTNRVSMSTMDRYQEISPVAYSPVLGGYGSKLMAGQTATFSFRYSIQNSDWYTVFRHAARDIYQFSNFLNIQKQRVSLIDRVEKMHRHLQNNKTSGWHTWTYGGLKMGANGAKNADIGAMWMLANISDDSVIKSYLPYVRNFKLAQQVMEPGFFQFSAGGEYGGTGGFKSEVGNWVEPLFTTYYTIIDIGNMLLFNSGDDTLRNRLRLAADKLLSWQHEDGSWDVAYDKISHQLTYPELKDLRPTWYGLLVAYRVLGDEKYLLSAERAANWFIKNGVDKGNYLGVCGDAQDRFDFGTAQSAQALLDLFETTRVERYKKAAIEVCKLYSTTIFTHPIVSNKKKLVNGIEYEDWEINQTGLGVEHAQGSAPGSGPILITSHTGLFVRMFELTKDSLFLEMARAGARGRHAFMDSVSGQAVYYWKNLDKVGSKVMQFPHQTYWQIGWIMDYLLAETKLRSNGNIDFPRGFMTPKVGPHETYGFALGKIFNNDAQIWLPDEGVVSTNVNFEPIMALSKNKDVLYIILLNQSTDLQKGHLILDPSKLFKRKNYKLRRCETIYGIKPKIGNANSSYWFNIPAWGISVISVKVM